MALKGHSPAGPLGLMHRTSLPESLPTWQGLPWRGLGWTPGRPCEFYSALVLFRQEPSPHTCGARQGGAGPRERGYMGGQWCWGQGLSLPQHPGPGSQVATCARSSRFTLF